MTATATKKTAKKGAGKGATPDAPPLEPRIPDASAALLFAARGRVRDCVTSYLAADKERKDRKADLDAAQDDVNRIIDDIEAGPGPLFDEAAEKDA